MFAEMTNAIKDMAKQGLEYQDDKIDVKLPNVLNRTPEVTDAALEERMKAAAYSAGSFFELPNIKVKEGGSIGVALRNPKDLSDDMLVYNLDQFKDLECTSFEDMTKMWSHECGHRLLQDIYDNPWASELGSDFFVGIRSEMLGLPVSDFEKKLGKTDPSSSHLGDSLRLEAINYGRQVAAGMMEKNIQPTWRNCLEAFDRSPFSRVECPDDIKGLVGEEKDMDVQSVKSNEMEDVKNFINDREYWYKKAANAKEQFEYHTKQAKNAAHRGDLSAARDHAKTAESYHNKMEDCKKTAERCTK